MSLNTGIKFNTNGEILQDLKKTGKERPWKEKKLNNIKVAESFKRMDLMNRFFKLLSCGSTLTFEECPNGHKKLKRADFCKDRLCPLCNWRRSGMLSKQVLEILHIAQQQQEQEEKPRMRFLFLTLTVKNCNDKDLGNTIDSLFEGFNRLFKYKKVDNPIIGWVRCLEITRNKNRDSYNYDTYHPHFHVLIGVKPSYFGKDYTKQKEWIELWRKALNIDYNPLVHIEVVKPKVKGQTVEAAVAEAAKYTVKETDYVLPDKKEMDKVIGVLSVALKSRRLIGYGKLFKEIKSRMKMKDVEDENADLIGLRPIKEEQICTCDICGSTIEEILYKWHMGEKDYLKVEE